MVLSSEYNIRTCYEAYQKFGIQLYGLNLVKNNGGSIRLHGNMQAQIYQGGSVKGSVSYTRTRNNYIIPEEGVFWPIPTVETKEVELYKPDLENDYIFLSAEFTEDDSIGADDYLGKTEKKILLKDVQTGKDKDGDGDNDYIRVNLTEDPDIDMRTYFYAWRIY